MNATKQLHDAGQSLWVDNISREMLDDGTLQRYIEKLSVTGLTSNPTIFDKSIGSGYYDDAISEKLGNGDGGEPLFFQLAIEDLRRAADLFAPAHERSRTVDGFVSLEVSPKLAYDAASTSEQAKQLHAEADRDNLFIKIPGTKEGLPAVEECIYEGVPINVTLLFSRDQYLAAAQAYTRGIKRRIEAGRSPNVRSVASLFVSRWDKAVLDRVPDELRDRLGIAIGADTYAAYRELIDSDEWLALANEGARPQRLLFASTSTKDPKASDVLYVEGLAAPYTVNTMPDATLEAFADHGNLGGLLSADGSEARSTLDEFGRAGFDLTQLAGQLQSDGADAFVKSWDDLLERISARTKELA